MSFADSVSSNLDLVAMDLMIRGCGTAVPNNASQQFGTGIHVSFEALHAINHRVDIKVENIV